MGFLSGAFAEQSGKAPGDEDDSKLPPSAKGLAPAKWR
jgi:hypothetical protein